VINTRSISKGHEELLELKKNFYLKNISIFCTTLLSQRPMFDSQPETNCFSTNCVPDLDICEERIKEAVQTKRKLHY